MVFIDTWSNKMSESDKLTKALSSTDCQMCGKFIDSDWKAKLIRDKLIVCGECYWWLRNYFSNLKEGE